MIVDVSVPSVTVSVLDSVPAAPPDPTAAAKFQTYVAPAYDCVANVTVPPSHVWCDVAGFVIVGVGTLPPTDTVAVAVAEQVAPFVTIHENVMFLDRPLVQLKTTLGFDTFTALNSTSAPLPVNPVVAPVALQAYVRAVGTGAAAPDTAVNV